MQDDGQPIVASYETSNYTHCFSDGHFVYFLREFDRDLKEFAVDIFSIEKNVAALVTSVDLPTGFTQFAAKRRYAYSPFFPRLLSHPLLEKVDQE